MNFYKNRTFLFLGILALMLCFFVFRGRINSSFLQNLPGQGSEPSPTPFAFEELTIPYLRNRQYVSKLGNLELISQNPNYTSYLTSYDSDGLKINGLLTRPSGERPEGGWPAIVFVHGYIPPGEYRTLSNYSDYVDYLAGNGFVVFKIDLRGHADSEGEPGGAYYSSDYVIDTLNAKAALESSGFVKKGSVGLWGHSMAGNVIFRALAARKDIHAIVIWAGAVYSYEDFSQFGISDNSYRQPQGDTERARRRRELFAKYGEFNTNSDFWRQVPATNYLDDINGAVQIHHSDSDPVVDIGYSRNLMSILEGAGIAHELFEYAGDDHNISGNFNLAMQRTAEFFEKELK